MASRNDPCPCGSGKKLKRCCGGRNAKAGPIDTFEASRRTAFVGLYGQMRKDAIRDFLAQKTIALDLMSKNQSEEAARRGKTVTCSNGCSSCCRQYISASIWEADAIVSYLYDHSDLLGSFKKRYLDWRTTVKRNEAIFQRLLSCSGSMLSDPSNTSNRTDYFKANEEYFNLQVMCPFNEHNSCQIYTVRPYACASVASTSSAKDCCITNQHSPEIIYASPSMDVPSFYKQPALGPMPLLVYQLLMSGWDYLAATLGMHQRVESHFASPEVQTVLRELAHR